MPKSSSKKINPARSKKAKPKAKVSAIKLPIKPRRTKATPVRTRIHAAKSKVVEHASRRPVVTLSIILASVAIGLVFQIKQLKAPLNPYFGPRPVPQFGVKLHVQLKQLLANVQTLHVEENQRDLKVINQAAVDQYAKETRTDLQARRWPDAKADLDKLNQQIKAWQSRLSQLVLPASISGIAPTSPGQFIPILLYHYTPSDFEQQLIYLRDHGYTAITLDQVANGLRGHSLPTKPVVITFDDGYSDQWQAFQLLKKYQMKATYYIIISRANSGCSAGISNCDSLYLSWDQVKALDASGLITIGDHTVDHPELSKLTPDLQQAEILDARTKLVQELGHPVVHFAYPYGEYNADTIKILAQNGFRTAVTTVPGFYQPPGSYLLLNRIRQAYILP